MNKPDFFDIYGYEYTPLWQTPWFYIPLLIAIGLVCTYAIKRYLTYRRQMKNTIPLWQWAHQELDLCAKKNPQTKIEYKEAYFQVTSILKTYFSQRFGWSLYDKTDEEVILFLHDVHLTPDIRIDLEKVLKGSQTIKFADAATLNHQFEEDIARAHQSITKTSGDSTTP